MKVKIFFMFIVKYILFYVHSAVQILLCPGILQEKAFSLKIPILVC